MTDRQFLASIAASLATAFIILGVMAHLPARAAENHIEATAYSFEFTGIEGMPMPLDDFRGKTLLVVNTASLCGFTHQYADLQALWESYRERGLVVLGVPSNDFGGQEPGTEREIKEFCEVNFNIDFPLTEKVHVKGGDAHPFYQWAVRELGSEAAPRWNFHKYLVSPEGQLVGWFATADSPTSPKVTDAIEGVLPVGQG